MKKIVYLFTASILLSCSTYRTIEPEFLGESRISMNLEKPLIVSFKDSRSNKGQTEDIITKLESTLKIIYGKNIIIKPYFDKTPENRISMKITIKEIGSSFGIRTFNYQTWEQQVTAASSSISTAHGTAVATAVISQPVLVNRTNFEGYWVGTSYLEINIIDNIIGEKYDFPFVAEDIVANNYGYKSAKKASRQAWNSVSKNLLDLIDVFSYNLGADPVDIILSDANAYYERAENFRNSEEYQKAINDYSRAIELDPNDAYSYNNRGVAKRLFGLSPCEDYRKACELGMETSCDNYFSVCE